MIWTIDALATAFDMILNSVDKGKVLNELRKKKEGKEPSNAEVREFEHSIIRRVEEYQIEKANDK